MERSLVRATALLAIASLTVPAFGRGGPDPDRFRRMVAGFPSGQAVTVDLLAGAARAGRIHSIEPDSFSIRDVDLKQVVTIRYDEVGRIVKGIGRHGFGGRRVNPRTNRIAGLAILGGLIVILIVAVVEAGKS
jgi:hypothetical protein